VNCRAKLLDGTHSDFLCLASHEWSRAPSHMRLGSKDTAAPRPWRTRPRSSCFFRLVERPSCRNGAHVAAQTVGGRYREEFVTNRDTHHALTDSGARPITSTHCVSSTNGDPNMLAMLQFEMFPTVTQSDFFID
jgi:hypothetical protein